MINLRRVVPVRCFDVVATVAQEQRRPEFISIIKLAHDLGGSVTASQVQRELFQPLPEQASRLALERCVALRMLDREEKDDVFSINELGKLSIEIGKVLVAEQGIWRLVHANRVKTEATYEVLSQHKKGKTNLSRGPQTPDLLKNCVNKTASRSLQSNQFMQIQEVGPRGEDGPKGNLMLELSWSKNGSPTVCLTGQLPDSELRIDSQLDADVSAWTYEKLWLELASAATGLKAEHIADTQTSLGQKVVPVSFSEMGPKERRDFHTDFAVPESEFSDIGKFQKSSLAQVAISPATDHDAQQWCEWLQWDAITGYATPETLRGQGTDVLAKFKFYQPNALKPEDLRNLALNSNDYSKARHIFAPADLGLWR